MKNTGYPIMVKINFSASQRPCGWRILSTAIQLAVLAASIYQARADIALVDTPAEAGLSLSIAESGQNSVTITNFTVSPMANVLVVLVEDKGASAVNSEPATLTWGSQTIFKAVAQDNPNTNLRGESIYYLFNPTPGTNNLTATVANNPLNVEITAYTLSGVNAAVAPKVGSGGNVGGSVSFTVANVVAGSWAAANTTWSAQTPVPTVTGTGGSNVMTSFLMVDNQSTIITAGYIAGLSGGTDTFMAAWSGNNKNNFAVAVFTPLATAINITAASATPNPVPIGTPVLLSVTATSIGGPITNVVVNASAIGGPPALQLNLSGGNVYTNTVTATIRTLGAILPVTVRNSAGNTLAGSLRVAVQTIADQQFDAYNNAYLIQVQNNLGVVYYARSLTNRNTDGGWTLAIDIEGAEDAYEYSPSPVRQQLVNSLCTHFLLQSPIPWDGDGWNDDIGWFSLVLVRGYQMTGNTNFLNAAEYGFNMAFARGWDTNYNNGGIWELQPNDTSNPHKEPLSTDSLLQTVCMIYQSTGDTNYLNRALQIYGWVRTNIFNPSTGLVYNDIYTNGTVDMGANLYNEGTFVECANLLHNITGQQMYYDDAHKAVDYAIAHLTSNGIFSKNATYLYTWAAEFARGMGHFVKDNNLYGTYYPFMLANANAAWNCRRPDNNLSWNVWTAPTPTTNDLSIGWAVNAVAMMWATPTGPATNFTLNYGGVNIIQPGGADWNTANNWNPLGVGAQLSSFANPASSFEIKTGSRLRTPTASTAFPGLQLIVSGNGIIENNGGNPVNVGELRFKNADAVMTNYFNNLVLNGGELDAGNNGVQIIQGTVTVASNSTIYVDSGSTGDRGFQLDARLTGSGNLFWHQFSGSLGGMNLQITGAGNSFTGQWIVDQGVLVGVTANTLGTNNITVGASGSIAAVETLYDLNNTNASLALGANGKMFLHQTNHFASVIINGTPLTNGIYSFAQLNSAYPTKFPASWTQQAGSTFTAGSGQIIVGNVVAGPPLVPQITSIGLNGTGLSLMVTNGTPGGSWALLQSTNIALPLNLWQTNTTGTFDNSGNLSTNILNAATNTQNFYLLKVQ